MNKEHTYSWIFLAIALASENELADIYEISAIADGINHAVPTQKELHSSIVWLIEKGLIKKSGKKIQLTYEGSNEYDLASKKEKIISRIWNNLEERIKNYA